MTSHISLAPSKTPTRQNQEKVIPSLNKTTQATSNYPVARNTTSELRLLVCIAFHFQANRLQFLETVLHRLLDTYTVFPLRVVVDSNSKETETWVKEHFRDSNILSVNVHGQLAHPHHLTWKHREYMRKSIDEFDVFMYMEDDMDLPFPNYLRTLENFELLWPSMLPVFARIESANGQLYNTDNKDPTIVGPRGKSLIERGGRSFVGLNSAYSAMWLMPREALRTSFSSPAFFSSTPNSGLIREEAASPMWQLNKPGVVEVEGKQVSPLSWVYHLPNNYATSRDGGFGTLPISRVLCFQPQDSQQCL